MLSGYRVFSRRYVKSLPGDRRSGFETETELTVHALELRMPYGELSCRPTCARPEGSVRASCPPTGMAGASCG